MNYKCIYWKGIYYVKNPKYQCYARYVLDPTTRGVSVPKLSLRIKGFHGAVVLKYWSGEQDIMHYIKKQIKRKLLESCNMSQYREQSERRKNQQIGINENYLYIFNIYLHVSSVKFQT